jgi:hypothetical protein
VNQTHEILRRANGANSKVVKTFSEFLDGEIRPEINKGEGYRRDFCVYSRIPHGFNKITGLNLKSLYSGDYNRLIAANIGSIESRFNKVLSLPRNKRDNLTRIQYLKDCFKSFGWPDLVIDVGSGIGVFPYESASELGCDIIATDPDEASCGFMASLGKFKVKCLPLEGLCLLEEYYYSAKCLIITLNQVLEHFEDPVKVLRELHRLIGSLECSLYIEVPELTRNLIDYGADCPAFYLDHYHSFSCNSMAIVAAASGWEVISSLCSRTPSGKTVVQNYLKPISLRVNR